MTVTIDGNPLPATGTLLDTLLAAGVAIPHLCKDDNLPAIGACRTCLVEADGRIVAACATPAEGLREVLTNSDRVRTVREVVLALTAAMQAKDDDGLGGPCGEEARQAFGSAGAGAWRRRGIAGTVDASNPFFEFDAAQCILCGRCTAACQSLQHIGAIGMAGRGRDVRVTPGAGVAFGESICTSCGSCVAACPTTALRPKGRRS